MGADNPLAISAASFAKRDGRIDASMHYPRAIGFVIVKLSGLKVRVTTFSMKRIISNSEFIQFSSVCSKLVHLVPGRYAIVPFTDIPIDNAVIDYCLVTQYKEGSIDFEINDIIKERPMDTVPSDDEDDDNAAAEKRKLLGPGHGACPLLLSIQRWEWEEDVQESGAIAVYEQINDLAFLLRSLRKDVKDLQKMQVQAEAEGKGRAAMGEDSSRKTKKISSSKFKGV